MVRRVATDRAQQQPGRPPQARAALARFYCAHATPAAGPGRVRVRGGGSRQRGAVAPRGGHGWLVNDPKFSSAAAKSTMVTAWCRAAPGLSFPAGGENKKVVLILLC
mmetsp:Transcript_11301/g.47201  ORF Transcript_11301/g.47201 Transcript_11301/m.47201 type:complete len:107 (+) Transcript_11301:1074-1394(+)